MRLSHEILSCKAGCGRSLARFQIWQMQVAEKWRDKLVATGDLRVEGALPHITEMQSLRTAQVISSLHQSQHSSRQHTAQPEDGTGAQ